MSSDIKRKDQIAPARAKIEIKELSQISHNNQHNLFKADYTTVEHESKNKGVKTTVDIIATDVMINCNHKTLIRTLEANQS